MNASNIIVHLLDYNLYLLLSVSKRLMKVDYCSLYRFDLLSSMCFISLDCSIFCCLIIGW